MANFDESESSEDSFTLTAQRPNHISSSPILLTSSASVAAFTSAQYSGVEFWAVDFNNANRVTNSQPFTGYRINGNNESGLYSLTLPAGNWYVAVIGRNLSGTQTNQGFDELSFAFLPGSSFTNNIPMSVSGNAGAYKYQGFTIAGSPPIYIETEGSGGKYMIMNDSQLGAFVMDFRNGYTGSTYSYTYALGDKSGGPGTEIEGQLQLSPGKWNLLWINDSGGWAGGAANLSAYTQPATSGNITIASTTIPITPTTTGTSVFRFFDKIYGTHFFTANQSERDTLIATRPDLGYEGVGTKAIDIAKEPSAAPIYRFFDTVYGTHFFTASKTERDTVLSTRPDLNFEGIGYYEHTTQQAGDTAVYRFFDTHLGTHFYTADSNERATIVSTRADLRDEGIGFYAPKP